jgi:dolichyl-phosphate-mannose-protein mannosyltransferase
MKSSNFRNVLIISFLMAFLLRMFLSPFGTLSLDQGTFISWASSLVHSGFRQFYNGWSDYLPGYLYFLWGLGKINLLNLIPPVILFKLPAIFADLLTGYLIFKILTKYKNEKWGLIGALIYIFNPAILANSALWGQVDSLTALSSLAAIYFLESNFILSALLLSAGTLIKPQTAFIFPVIAFYMFRNKWSLKKVISYIVLGMAVFVLGFIPFFNKGNIFEFIINRLQLSANQYPYTSVNAFNFWGIFGFWKKDSLIFQFGGYLFVTVATIFLYFKSEKSKLHPYLLSAFIFLSSFMFFTRMHERHLLPVFAPLAIAAVGNPIFLFPYVGLSVLYLANLGYSYKWVSSDFVQIFPEMMIKLLCVMGLGFLIFVCYTMLKKAKVSWKVLLLSLKQSSSFLKKSTDTKSPRLPRINISPKILRIVLYVILAFAFLTRIFDLSSPRTMYFDEVYHAFTAKVMMGADSAKAWEWWNTPPEGFAYEWTHPPLAKLGMVLGMLIFGQNSFGWRIPEALLGFGAVFMVYKLAKTIFKDEAVGVISAGVFSLDGLPLVMSRIGMNDSYILFFSLLSIYFFIKQKDLPSAIAYGLAISSKWSALWAIPILFILWLKRKNKFSISLFLSFSIIPITIYLLTYLPMFTTGHDLSVWWGMQKQMWWYHTGLVATHPYTSPWWSWPFMIRPIYLYTSDEVAGMVARIYAIGNPFVFWLGIASVVTCGFYSFLEKNKKLAFVVFSYLIFFVPWAASPRIMFIYHYLPSIPFLAIATGYILRRFPKLILGYLLICLSVFIYFYPHWAGLSVPLWLDRSYYWVSNWR